MIFNQFKSLQTHLWILLALIFFSPMSSVFASAVIICKVDAKVLQILPKSKAEANQVDLEIKVISVAFSEGHSAGTNCRIQEGSTHKISLKTNGSSQYKVGKKIQIFHQTVFNMSPEGRNVYESWRDEE